MFLFLYERCILSYKTGIVWIILLPEYPTLTLKLCIGRILPNTMFVLACVCVCVCVCNEYAKNFKLSYNIYSYTHMYIQIYINASGNLKSFRLLCM